MNEAKKIILGIDPGIARMGYGLISLEDSNINHIAHGIIETDMNTPEHLRLGDIYKTLQSMVKQYNPHVIAVEDIFYFKNQKTLISVSQARGIVLLLAADNHKQCYSFTPLQVKQAVSGYGQADKKQVQTMVKTLLKLNEEPHPDDAADALAVAMCCASSLNYLERI